MLLGCMIYILCVWDSCHFFFELFSLLKHYKTSQILYKIYIWMIIGLLFGVQVIQRYILEYVQIRWYLLEYVQIQSNVLGPCQLFWIGEGYFFPVTKYLCNSYAPLHAIISGCGAYMRTPTGNFTSLNYPNPYPNYRECSWNIEVAPSNRVELTIHDQDIQQSANCTSDQLIVSSFRLFRLFQKQLLRNMSKYYLWHVCWSRN